MLVADLRICGFADLLVADWWVVGGIIPNFLLPQAFRKFILFGGEGEVSVRREILFGLAGCLGRDGSC